MNFATTQAYIFQGVKALCYAQAGMGKTFMCATAPAPLILSAEAGLLSLKDYDISVVEIHTSADLMEAYRFCASPQAQQFETICIDSISEIAEIVLAEKKQSMKRGDRMLYPSMMEDVTAFIKLFRNLPAKNLYVTAKADYVQDDKGVGRYGLLMPSAKIARHITHLFDEVFFLSTRKTANGTERVLQTAPDFSAEAKDRSGVLAMFEPANLSYLFNKIKGGVNGTNTI